MRRKAVAALIVTAAATSSVTAAVRLNGVNINVTARTSAGGAPDTDMFRDAGRVTPGPVQVDVTDMASVTDGTGNGAQVIVDSGIAADFIGAERGTIDFRQNAVAASQLISSTPVSTAASGTPFGTYNLFFEVDRTSFFRLDYSVVATDSNDPTRLFGQQAYLLAGPNEDRSIFNLAPIVNNAPGSFGTYLDSGVYHLVIQDFYPATANAAAGSSQSVSLASRYVYVVSDAPEPATWGLMLTGLGGCAALLRRRRRQSATSRPSSIRR